MIEFSYVITGDGDLSILKSKMGIDAIRSEIFVGDVTLSIGESKFLLRRIGLFDFINQVQLGILGMLFYNRQTWSYRPLDTEEEIKFTRMADACIEVAANFAAEKSAVEMHDFLSAFGKMTIKVVKEFRTAMGDGKNLDEAPELIPGFNTLSFWIDHGAVQ